MGRYLSLVLNGVTIVSVVAWDLEISLLQQSVTFFLIRRKYKTSMTADWQSFASAWGFANRCYDSSTVLYAWWPKHDAIGPLRLLWLFYSSFESSWLLQASGTSLQDQIGLVIKIQASYVARSWVTTNTFFISQLYDSQIGYRYRVDHFRQTWFCRSGHERSKTHSGNDCLTVCGMEYGVASVIECCKMIHNNPGGLHTVRSAPETRKLFKNS